MRGLYVGIKTAGTTSQLRADTLLRAGTALSWNMIDTDARFLACPRWSRTLAFRLRIGPAVRALNHQVMDELDGERFEIAWIDKGANLWPGTIRKIRSVCRRLVYYTPDTSFAANKSRFFEATAALYDLVVTTKSFELDEYRRLIPENRILLVTQSFDDSQHRLTCAWDGKRHEAVLIGLCEPDRETCIAELLSAGIEVRIGGRGWEAFVARHQDNPRLHYEGSTVFGDHYVDTLARASVGLGLLTKRFAELHTTRTFEIPACGTALATVRNVETASFFEEDEAIFFNDYGELAQNLIGIMQDNERLRSISEAGTNRVLNGDYSNLQIVKKILSAVDVAVT